MDRSSTRQPGKREGMEGAGDQRQQQQRERQGYYDRYINAIDYRGYHSITRDILSEINKKLQQNKEEIRKHGIPIEYYRKRLATINDCNSALAYFNSQDHFNGSDDNRKQIIYDALNSDNNTLGRTPECGGRRSH